MFGRIANGKSDVWLHIGFDSGDCPPQEPTGQLRRSLTVRVGHILSQIIYDVPTSYVLSGVLSAVVYHNDIHKSTNINCEYFVSISSSGLTFAIFVSYKVEGYLLHASLHTSVQVDPKLIIP